MFKLKTLAAIIMSALLVDGAMAAEFAKEMSPTTVELMEKSIKETPVEDIQPPALDQANDWLKSMGKIPGPNKDSFIAIGHYEQKANARNVSTVRSLGAMVAQMQAKAEIVKYLNSEVSASTRATLPPNTPMLTEFDEAKEALKEQLNELMGEYEDALRAVDAETSKQVAGINMDELFVAGIAATLSKYGVNLDIPGLKAESKQKLEELQNQVASLEAKLEDIKKRTKEMAGALNSEEASEVTLLAEMVVSGSVTVKSFERFNDAEGVYEVAVVVVWSTAQERFIRSVLGVDTEPVVLKTNSTKTLAEYVNAMNWNAVAGTRWFIDNEGAPHLFAVGVVELQDKKVNTRRRAKAKAEADATHNLALTLQADVRTQLEAKQKVQNVRDENGDEAALTAEQLQEEVNEKVENMKLIGVSTVFEGVRPSPITTRDVYVKVLHLDPLSMKDALEKLNRQLYIARETARKQQEVKGYVDQSLTTVKEARRDAESYARGAEQAAAKAAEQKAAEQARAAEQKLGKPVRESRPTTSYDNVRMRSGSFSGGAADDFSF